MLASAVAHGRVVGQAVNVARAFANEPANVLTPGEFASRAAGLEFTGGLPWAHIDIAGTAWAESREPYQPKGATGAGVRTLIEVATKAGALIPIRTG